MPKSESRLADIAGPAVPVAVNVASGPATPVIVAVSVLLPGVGVPGELGLVRVIVPDTGVEGHPARVTYILV